MIIRVSEVHKTDKTPKSKCGIMLRNGSFINIAYTNDLDLGLFTGYNGQPGWAAVYKGNFPSVSIAHDQGTVVTLTQE